MTEVPEYPTRPCQICGSGEYWLRNEGWGPPAYVCCTCHPEPAPLIRQAVMRDDGSLTDVPIKDSE